MNVLRNLVTWFAGTGVMLLGIGLCVRALTDIDAMRNAMLIVSTVSVLIGAAALMELFTQSQNPYFTAPKRAELRNRMLRWTMIMLAGCCAFGFSLAVQTIFALVALVGVIMLLRTQPIFHTDEERDTTWALLPVAIALVIGGWSLSWPDLPKVAAIIMALSSLGWALGYYCFAQNPQLRHQMTA